ncbi:hypothetical protein AB0M02_43925 [Actinoplanes sp. NPDC051861]|uniref:hypothetical protein n=1 Tax=Actinoplanes sp. NPDC051861 TaxID=3155170 RepID=UPI003431EE8D
MSTAPYVPPPFPGQFPPPPGPVAPPPPPGPGVHPPFPAPPVEGKGRRIGLGLGIGAGVLVLVCGGGAAALFGLGSAADDALNEQAAVVVGRYMESVQKREFAKAYDQLCSDAQDEETRAEYTVRMLATEPVKDYDVGDFNALGWTVPVDVTYTDGDSDRLEARLVQNTSTGAFEVCDVGE